jgi:hypothetical protein
MVANKMQHVKQLSHCKPKKSLNLGIEEYSSLQELHSDVHSPGNPCIEENQLKCIKTFWWTLKDSFMRDLLMPFEQAL